MKLREIANTVEIDSRKLTEYALNPLHPKGQHKARVLQAALGYTSADSQAIIEQIERQVLDVETVVQRIDVYGHHVFTDLEIIGAEGQRAVIRVAWEIAPDSQQARLVSLYLRKVGR